jgi:hypothetical protein
MPGKHFFGAGIHRNIPAFGEKPPPLAGYIRPGNEFTVRIGANSPRVSAGFFAQGIAFQKACYAA